MFKKDEWASCNADPAKGIADGAQLYTSVCGICHDAEHRASTVPDLKNLPHPTDAAYWRTSIANGLAGLMMSAFAKSEGGSMDDQQIGASQNFWCGRFRALPDKRHPRQISAFLTGVLAYTGGHDVA